MVFPLKVQGSAEPLKGERVRPVITYTLKTVVHCGEDEMNFPDLSDIRAEISLLRAVVAVPETRREKKVPFVSLYSDYSSHKIRAPGYSCLQV